MGIYLGQLPPAEIARLKAELAETLIANFCYPRFFDYRTGFLQMRPVDRTKRQEVWLYLSSVDFTAWSRIDLMSGEFQHQIERLFIQFVQRNRSFFGEQGRRRASDIRTLIGSCAASVSQGLRNHLTGQKANNPPFGSPRPVVSWAATTSSAHAEPTWEQIVTSTMVLQQQLQEVRGEVKAPAGNDMRSAQAPAPAASGSASRRPAAASSSAPGSGYNITQQPTIQTAPVSVRQNGVSPATPEKKGVSSPHLSPAAMAAPAAPVVARRTETRGQSSQLSNAATARKSEPLSPQLDANPEMPAARASNPLQAPMASSISSVATGASTAPSVKAANSNGVKAPANDALFQQPMSTQSRSVSPQTPTSASQSGALPVAPAPGSRETMSLGEDDIAIFEQMRHQLTVWIRIEAISAGIEISGQGSAQLLDLLRQQSRLDETRIQVVSTLLNLSNQVIKTGMVSVLDYKQALMFHLMHTRR